MSNPEQQMKEMQEKLLRFLRNSAGGSKRGGGQFRGGPPKGSFKMGAAIVALGALGLGFSASLYNVDGGHRAIKYSRVSGVKPDIYGE
ncbi:Prohibitin-2, subunit of the prohibitin complex (Phb1p-Phb2p), partial [Coemansia sp. RSA 1290]